MDTPHDRPRKAAHGDLAPKALVAVVWEDAHARITDDYSEAEIARDFHKPAVYTTFGLLVLRDDAGVTLACDYSEDGYRGLNFIPSAMVREIVDLGVPKRKRTRAPRRVEP